MRKEPQADRKGWSLDEEKRKEWGSRPAELGRPPPGSAPRTGPGRWAAPGSRQGREALGVERALWGWTGGKRGESWRLRRGGGWDRRRPGQSGLGERGAPAWPGVVSAGKTALSGVPVRPQGPSGDQREARQPADLEKQGGPRPNPALVPKAGYPGASALLVDRLAVLSIQKGLSLVSQGKAALAAAPQGGAEGAGTLTGSPRPAGSR